MSIEISNVIRNDLTISNKGVINWAGNFENLQRLVESLDLPTVKWSSPGGDCKLYESDGIAIRWYSTKGTLTLKGDKSEEIRGRIAQQVDILNQEDPSLNLANTEEDDNLHMEITTSLNSTEAAVSYDKNFHTKTMISSNSTEAAVSQDEILHSQTIKSSKFIQAGITQDENFQEENIASPQSIHLEKILKEALQKIDAKVDALVADFQEFKTTNLGHDLSLNQSFLVQNLIKENNQLKADSKKSMERINTLTLVASDLNTTIKSLENEKLSLMTAIKLIQVDYSQDVSNINREGNNEESWKEVSNKRRIVQQNKESIVNTNRYSILTVEDDDNVSESNQDQQSTCPQHRPSKSYSGPESENLPKHFVVVFEVVSECFSIWAFIFISYLPFICSN